MRYHEASLYRFVTNLYTANFFCPFLTQVGNNIKGDVRKLRKDFPGGDVVNYSELTSLTSRPTAQRRLADLVTMTSGKYLDKDVGGGALADWTQDSFSPAELKYATSDAWASLFVWRELERRKVGLLPPAAAEQPPQEGVSGGSADSPSAGPGSSEMPLEPEDGEVEQEDGSRDLWNLRTERVLTKSFQTTMTKMCARCPLRYVWPVSVVLSK